MILSKKSMDPGTWLLVIGAGLFLLLLLFLPRLIHTPPTPKTNEQNEAEREAAYRRGLLIGGLLEEAHETQQADSQHLLEQVMVEQMIIEHIQKQRDNETWN